MTDATHPCEQEPLAWSGHIQPFGALLGVDKHTLSVTHASDNVADWLGVSPPALFGQSVAQWSAQLSDILQDLLLEPAVVERHVRWQGQVFWMRISEDASHFVVDIEAVATHASKPKQDPDVIRGLAYSPDDAEQTQALYQTLIDGVRALTGFDRVMLYQFLPDWSGQVVAERAGTGLGSYLDLRFPATDIPKIARDLYVQNASRTVCDAHQTPVAIQAATGQPLNLTLSDLRSVSPVHLRYLQHMGVAASYSMGIVINGELWGLVACHHYAPKVLAPCVRRLSTDLVHRFRRALHGALAKQKMQHYDRREAVLRRLKLDADAAVQSRKAFVGAHGAAIMGLVEAEGFAWVMSEQDSPVWAQAGLVPSTTVLDALDAWWRQQSDQDVYACDQRVHWTGGIAELDATFDAQVITEGLGSIAGVLAVKVYVGHQWQRAYWFKPEVVEHLTWAGNPNKPMQEDSQAQGLSPRRSFEQWVETKRGVSAPFLSYDDLTARRFLHVVGGLWREV